MIGSSIKQIAATAAGALAGLGIAALTTRHLALGVDPVGLLATWFCYLTVCSVIGSAVGGATGRPLGVRPAVRPAGATGAVLTPTGTGQRAA
jgi:hypothetical protein